MKQSAFSPFDFSCKLQRNPLSETQTWCWGLYRPLHTHMQALLVPVIMMLVDPLTRVMYFCAVCQLPRCVFWLQSGSCIVRNVDEKWQAIITCHSCPLSLCITANRRALLKYAQPQIKTLFLFCFTFLKSNTQYKPKTLRPIFDQIDFLGPASFNLLQ